MKWLRRLRRSGDEPLAAAADADSVISDHQLLLYATEGLSPADLASIERRLRDDPRLQQRLEELRQHIAGGHSIEEIWRRHRLSCPPRQTLGNYLLGSLEKDEYTFVRLHLEETRCPFCRASVDDLREQAAGIDVSDVERRRKRFYESRYQS